jgi:hypothetical protein
MKVRQIILLVLLGVSTDIPAQRIALKTNLLYGAATLTPNIGGEIALGDKTTLDIAAGYNPWNHHSTADDSKKLVHWLGMAEYRYWLCQKFSGHFFGVHALGSQYNIAGHRIPLLFGKNSDAYRFEGWAIGAGVSYGYQFILDRHWNLEMNIGVGYIRMKYDKYKCMKCGNSIANETKNYFGPNKAGVSLVYTF